MSFFFDPEVAMSSKLMEVIYMFIGFMVVYTAVKNLRDKENPSRAGTFIFWFVLGILMAFGQRHTRAGDVRACDFTQSKKRKDGCACKRGHTGCVCGDWNEDLYSGAEYRCFCGRRGADNENARIQCLEWRSDRRSCSGSLFNDLS